MRVCERPRLWMKQSFEDGFREFQKQIKYGGSWFGLDFGRVTDISLSVSSDLLRQISEYSSLRPDILLTHMK